MDEQPTIANVIYTKDINKKHNKKWLDGVATFTKTNNPNRFRVILRDPDGKVCDDTYYKSPNNDGLIPETGVEERIGKFLVSIESLIENTDIPIVTNNNIISNESSESTTEISSQGSTTTTNINDSFDNPRRPLRKVGLSRKGIKPLCLYSTPPSKPDDNGSNDFKSASFNSKANSFVPPRKVSSSSPPTSNPSRPPSKKILPNTSSPGHSQSTVRKLRDVPRTFDEIIKFYSVFEDKTDENPTESKPTVDVKPEKQPKDNTNEENANFSSCGPPKSDPTDVLNEALSSDDERLNRIIKNNESDSDEDGPNDTTTTCNDEQDSIVSSEQSSLKSVLQPFKPPTQVAPASVSVSASAAPAENQHLSESLHHEVGLLWGTKLRTIGKRPPKIPIKFSSIDEYKHYFIQGIVFEMNSKIYDVYTIYQAALFTACNKSPICKTHGTKMAFYINSYNGSYYYSCTKAGCKNKQSVPPDAMLVDLEENETGDGMKINKTVRNKLAIESFMKKKHIAYHESRLFRSKENQIYLIFNSDKDENIEYTKDDVWVIFSERLKPFFVISESYGVYSNTKIEIGPFFNNVLASIPQQLKVTAIRVFNAQSEKQAIANLISLSEEQMPIIPILLSGGTFPSYLSTCDPTPHTQSQPYDTDSDDPDFVDPTFVGLPKEEIEQRKPDDVSVTPNVDIQAIASDICDKYNLNEDQRAALFKAADFFNDENQPMLLVHGLFGAGKSKLLSVIAIFLDAVLSAFGRSDKILVAASTNVAVDNVLSNLLDFGYKSFTRVGSVKKIRRSLLPFVTGHGTEESINELSSIMHDTLVGTPRKRGRRKAFKENELDDDSLESDELGNKHLSPEIEKKIVQEALKNAQNEMNRKVSKIDECRIVGVTCAACSFAAMSGRIFPFVLLDECSQQTEPISLIPMAFGCRNLICCGDPKQLPPTLVRESPEGYGRPLFTRMMTMVQPVMLSIQYRCHPRIADICSYSFYDGKVRNGISEEDRAPLFEMPTLCVFNVICGEESMKGGSIYNISEAITVVNLVKYLINIGVAPEDIGVIAFYKAQAEQIAIPLSEGLRRPIVDVSTVDAFQGDEREVIIISTTKTKQSSFVDSPNRINVAISRAKRHLFFVSRVKALMRLEKWNFVISRAGNRPNVSINLNSAPNEKWSPFGPVTTE